MNKQVWIGVDVAKESFWAAVACVEGGVEEWSVLPAQGFEHSKKGVGAFLAWLKERGVDANAVALL